MASYSKQVIDIQSSAGMTTDQSNEHQRRWTDRGWKDAAKHGNYDPTRAHLNFEIGKGGVVKPIDKSRSIPQRIKESLDSRGIVDPNQKKIAMGKEPNRRTVVNIIFGGSRDPMNKLAFGDQHLDLTHGADNSHLTRKPEIEEWAKDIYKFACEHWGEENIVGFYVHLDETNAHIHCTVLPVNSSNRISFKDVFAGKDKLEFQERTRRLHDELAVVNERWGLLRGADKYETGARHRTSEQYRAELRRQCDELELEVGEQKRTLEELYTAIRMAERRVKGLTTMVSNLEHTQSDLEEEIDRLESQLNAGAGDANALRRQIAELEGKLNHTNTNLEDKRRKLRLADRQLADLQQEIESAKSQRDDVQRQVKEASRDQREQMRMRATDAVFGKMVHELRSMLNTLTPQQKAAFDSDFFEALAEQPVELLRCTIYLMMGYVDGAIQIAKGSGGVGGGGSDLKWGRDPDEDDRKWAFRCMMQAHKMMRPAQGTQVKRK